jgi:hypothetical protein
MTLGMKILFSKKGFKVVMTEKLEQAASRTGTELLAHDPAHAGEQSPAKFTFSPSFLRVDTESPWFYLSRMASHLVEPGAQHVHG